MSRPSANLDRKLVEAARAMLPEAGLSGLSVREVCRRAGVNAGMFHYHFKSKEAFSRRVLGECYERFLGAFREAEGTGSPRERLRRVLVAVGRFSRDNRGFQAQMMRELLSAQPEMSRFAKENFGRHIGIVFRLLEECRREETVRPLPTPMLAMFAMSSMGVPAVAVTGLERNKVRAIGGRPLKEFAALMLSDAMIDVRADMVLAALAPAPAPRRTR